MAQTPAQRSATYRARKLLDPEYRKVVNEKQRERYRTNTEYRERMKHNATKQASKHLPRNPYRDTWRGVICAMLGSAKYRAKRDGYECTITHDDIVIPDVCPILGTPFTRSTTGKATPTSASLDKINPELGYVPGNVRVISHAANRLKDANTIATLERLLAYCRGEI